MDVMHGDAEYLTHKVAPRAKVRVQITLEYMKKARHGFASNPHQSDCYRREESLIEDRVL